MKQKSVEVLVPHLDTLEECTFEEESPASNPVEMRYPNSACNQPEEAFREENVFFLEDDRPKQSKVQKLIESFSSRDHPFNGHDPCTP